MHLLIPNCFLFLLLIQALPANCCIEHERRALLEFKGNLNDPSSRLASWTGDNCCNWAGITCNNQTGHVVRLNLQNYAGYYQSYLEWENHSLSGEINPILLSLSDLKHLDLSNNNFSGNRFPEFISSFKNLKYLNLASTGLSGLIPPQLGNLSKLQYLDLSTYIYDSTGLSGLIPPQLGNLSKLQHLDLSNHYMSDTFVSNAWWLSCLTLLKYLDMSNVYFNESKEWLQAIEMLPHLHTLILGGNSLTTIPTSINSSSFSYLEFLGVFGNCFNSTMPDWIGNLPNLKHLELWDCCFIGPIANQLGNLTSLETLYMVDELLEGPMPNLYNLKNLTEIYILYIDIGEDIRDVISKLANDTLYKLTVLSFASTGLTGNLIGWLNKVPNLNTLDLSFNNLNGTIPTDIGNLTHLESLDLGDNSFTGEVSEKHLNGLSMLAELSLSFNSINFTIGRNWIPPFQLEHVYLDHCKLGPYFPYWLQNQSQVSKIGLSDAGIVDIVPDWFWNFPYLALVNLSKNALSGSLPLSLKHLSGLSILLLQNNQFEGMVPYLPNYPWLVDLSVIFFHGTIEQLICGLDNLIILNLKKNNLSGNLPQCWPKTLQIISLAHNKFSGVIPDSISNSSSLFILQLNNNGITGDIPSTLESIQNLTILDIGENKLSGQIPKWKEKSLTNLEVLRLPSNMISGEIPIQILHLANLQVLDLSSNQISGSIPHSMELMLAMISTTENKNNSAYQNYLGTGGYYEVSISVVIKDLYLDYSNMLSLLRSIDLSSNNFIGEIPQTITTLHGLESLNLSNNNLHGSIPLRIGEMQLMESLDLRMNGLSGTIPHSLGNLFFLTTLNLSYNNLSGEIPTGYQLQTLNDPYIYIGNAYLCGPPLSKRCNTNQTLSGYNIEVNNNSDRVILCLFVVIGFGIGLWFICGTLLCYVK